MLNEQPICLYFWIKDTCDSTDLKSEKLFVLYL